MFQEKVKKFQEKVEKEEKELLPEMKYVSGESQRGGFRGISSRQADSQMDDGDYLKNN